MNKKKKKYINKSILIIKILVSIMVTSIVTVFVLSTSELKFYWIKGLINLLFLLFILSIILIFSYSIMEIIKLIKNKLEEDKKKVFGPLSADEAERFKDINNNDIKQLLPEFNKETFMEDLYKKYVDIQKALSDLDYDSLRKLCTDGLYNTYKKQLEVQNLKSEQKIKKDFSKKWTRIVSLKVENNTIIVKLRINIKFDEFSRDITTKEIKKGAIDAFKPLTYELVFVRSLENEVISKCPNCGASLEYISSIECEYCGSTIIKDASDFVLSKEKKIN